MTVTGIDRASLIVVDDVYADFERARAAALSRPFTPRTDSAFAYRTAPAPRWMEEEAIGRICEVLGPGSRAELIANHLHMSTAMDWKVNLHRGARIHIDEARWAGVLYLNTAEQCRGGTSSTPTAAPECGTSPSSAAVRTPRRSSPTAVTSPGGRSCSPWRWCRTGSCSSIPASSTRPRSTSATARPPPG